jgi:hypothetical protein
MLTTDKMTTEIAPSGEKYGLTWQVGAFCIEPVWTAEPNIQCILDICHEFFRQKYSQKTDDIEIKVEYLDEGAFNRVYEIDMLLKVKKSPDMQRKSGRVWDHQFSKYAFRASLPVDPKLKTSSEVATIQYLNEFTTIPVATVMHSSESAKNALGFEWMLQTYVPGHSLSSIWNQLGDAGRQRMTQQLAAIQFELFTKVRFQRIGNIYRSKDQEVLHNSPQNVSDKSSPDFHVDKIVSNPFILKGAVMDVVNRGPFRTTADWLSAQLENVILDCKRLEQSPDEDHLEAAERSRSIAQQLLTLLPRFFPDDGGVEETFLWHDDLSQSNIFCSEDGTITAILDWEATSCLPLWTAYYLPQLLQGADYTTEPVPPADLPDAVGTEDPLYQDRLLMWQQTKLRATYIESMREMWPEWEGEYKSTKRHSQRDFRTAVELCDSEWSWNMISKWLEANQPLLGTDDYVPLDMS